MEHLFRNDDGEIVAADTQEQAGKYHDCELGGAEVPSDDWSILPDDLTILICDKDGDGRTEAKTAREWANEYDNPELVSSTYT